MASQCRGPTRSGAQRKTLFRKVYLSAQRGANVWIFRPPARTQIPSCFASEYHFGVMFFAYLASSKGIWGAMPSGARLQFLAAVSLTFSGVGFLLDLANPMPGRPAHILFLVFTGCAIRVAYGFCLMRAPKFVPVLVAVHVASALAVPKHLGSFAIDWARVSSTPARVDEIGCIFAILLGYIFFIRFIRNQGLHYFRVQTEIELAQEIHRSLVPPIAVPSCGVFPGQAQF